MGCRIFEGREAGDDDGPMRAVLFDSTSGLAFGPIFDSPEEAEDFIQFCLGHHGMDPRRLTESEFQAALTVWQHLPTAG